MGHPVIDIAQSAGFAALVPASRHEALTVFLRKFRLSSGEQWAVDLYGDHLIGFGVQDGAIPPGQLENGAVQLSVRDAKTILASAVNMDAVVQSADAHLEAGSVILDPPQSMARQAFSAATRVHPHLSAMLKNFQMRQARQPSSIPLKPRAGEKPITGSQLHH